MWCGSARTTGSGRAITAQAPDNGENRQTTEETADNGENRQTTEETAGKSRQRNPTTGERTGNGKQANHDAPSTERSNHGAAVQIVRTPWSHCAAGAEKPTTCAAKRGTPSPLRCRRREASQAQKNAAGAEKPSITEGFSTPVAVIASRPIPSLRQRSNRQQCTSARTGTA